MKNADIRALNTAELKEKLAAETESLRKLKFAHRINSNENQKKIRQTRKIIKSRNI